MHNYNSLQTQPLYKFDFVYIRQKTFNMFPLDAGEEEKKTWAIICGHVQLMKLIED